MTESQTQRKSNWLSNAFSSMAKSLEQANESAMAGISSVVPFDFAGQSTEKVSGASSSNTTSSRNSEKKTS